MATRKPADSIQPNESTTNIEVAMQQHGFSGKTVEIKLFKSSDRNEPTTPFFGINGYAITIQREKWVRVPVEMADHIESIVYTVSEEDPSDPDNLSKMRWVEKQRFPLQRKD